MNIKAAIYRVTPRFLMGSLSKIENSPIGMRLARGAFWSLAGAVISRGLLQVASILVARMLGKTGFGEFGMIQSTVGMFGTFAGFGLGVTATKHVAEFRESDPDRAGRILALSELVAVGTGGLIAVAIFFVAPWLAEHSLKAPPLAGLLRIGSIILFLGAVDGAQTGALAGFESFKEIAYINLFVGLIAFPALVVGTYFGGLTGAVWALAFNLAVNWGLNHFALRKAMRFYGVPFMFEHCGRELGILWSFSLPALLGGAMVGPVNWVCSALLVNQADGYGQMGVFSAANQWCTAIIFVPSIISQVALPLLASTNSDSDRGRSKRIILLNICINAALALTVVIPLIVFSHLLMGSYGPGFDQGADVLRILALTAVLMAVNDIIGQVIASRSKMWLGFMFNALWASVLLVFAALFLKHGYGAFGLACATMIAYCSHTVLQGIYLGRILTKAPVVS